MSQQGHGHDNGASSAGLYARTFGWNELAFTVVAVRSCSHRAYVAYPNHRSNAGACAGNRFSLNCMIRVSSVKHTRYVASYHKGDMATFIPCSSDYYCTGQPLHYLSYFAALFVLQTRRTAGIPTVIRSTWYHFNYKYVPYK